MLLSLTEVAVTIRSQISGRRYPPQEHLLRRAIPTVCGPAQICACMADGTPPDFHREVATILRPTVGHLIWAHYQIRQIIAAMIRAFGLGRRCVSGVEIILALAHFLLAMALAL